MESNRAGPSSNEPKKPKRDARLAPGADATLGNVGPSRAPIVDEESDIYEGTSSGSGLAGKPRRGSREGHSP
jgi:hypothetical protein